MIFYNVSTRMQANVSYCVTVFWLVESREIPGRIVPADCQCRHWPGKRLLPSRRRCRIIDCGMLKLSIFPALGVLGIYLTLRFAEPRFARPAGFWMVICLQPRRSLLTSGGSNCRD
jgi:hypothetical protein